MSAVHPLLSPALNAICPASRDEAAHDAGYHGKPEPTDAEDREARLAVLAHEAATKRSAFEGRASLAISNWAGPTWRQAMGIIAHGIMHGQHDDAELGRLFRLGITDALVDDVTDGEVEEMRESGL